MSSDPVSVVRAFFDDLGRPGNLLAAMDAHMTEDAVWKNSGLPTAEGLEAAKGFMQSFIDGLGMQALGVDMLSIAADGDTVVTERVDYFEDADGKRVGSVEVCGAFDVRDAKITAWRDYFDPRPFIPEG